MSVNWVMLKDDGKDFVPLSKERLLHTSPARTALSISTPNTFPGKEPLKITCSGGCAYVTNQRVIYLPTSPTSHFQSFSAPILHLLDTHVTAPWFGANAWVAALKPVTGGGIPPQHAVVELKLTFKDGGAYDFHHVFEDVKERISQAMDNARESGQAPDLTDVPFEQLPAYEGPRSGVAGPSPTSRPPVISPTPIRPSQATMRSGQFAPGTSSAPTSVTEPSQQAPPDEPPPGYEEAQSSSVMHSVEESVRKANA